MAVGNAVLKFLASCGNQLDSSGLPLGSTASIPLTTMMYPYNIKLARSALLVNISDASPLNFSGLPTLVQAVSVVCTLDASILVGINGLGSETFVGKCIFLIGGTASNGINSVTVTALSANTQVDIIAAG